MSSPFRDVEDIKAEIRRRGHKLTGLSEKLGYEHTAISRRLRMKRPWPELDDRLALVLGVDRRSLFPNDYHPDGRPKSRTRTVKTIRPWDESLRLKATGDLT